MVQINYQTGVLKTTASYLTPRALPEASNMLRNAILKCNYKIIQQTPNMIKFKTPMSFTEWGFTMTATLNQNGGGTFVKIEGKSSCPKYLFLYLDVRGFCKKKISAMETYL